MGDNLAMRRPGTQFSGDGLNISWPLGGERQVIKFPKDQRSLRVNRRIAEGQIVEVDDPVTEVVAEETRVYNLMDGDEARAHKAIPAGPVIRFIYERADGTQGVAAVQEPHESDRYIEGVETAAATTEELSNEIAKRQVEAEKAAAKKAKNAPQDDEPEDMTAVITRQQNEAAADRVAQIEEAARPNIQAQAKAEAEAAAKDKGPDTDVRREEGRKPTVVARQTTTRRE